MTSCPLQGQNSYPRIGFLSKDRLLSQGQILFPRINFPSQDTFGVRGHVSFPGTGVVTEDTFLFLGLAWCPGTRFSSWDGRGIRGLISCPGTGVVSGDSFLVVGQVWYPRTHAFIAFSKSFGHWGGLDERQQNRLVRCTCATGTTGRRGLLCPHFNTMQCTIGPRVLLCQHFKTIPSPGCAFSMAYSSLTSKRSAARAVERLPTLPSLQYDSYSALLLASHPRVRPLGDLFYPHINKIRFARRVLIHPHFTRFLLCTSAGLTPGCAALVVYSTYYSTLGRPGRKATRISTCRASPHQRRPSFPLSSTTSWPLLS
jgi:hypothetical protein